MTKYEELYEQQHRNELRGFDLGLERYHTNRSKVISNPNKDNTTLAPEMTLLTKLMSKAVVAIQADIAGGSGSKRYRKACKMCQTMINCGYTHERLAFLTLQMCFNVDGKRTYQNAQTTFIKIGKTCKKDYEYMQLMDEAPAFLSKVEESLRSSHMQHRQNVIERARRIVRRKDGTVGMTDMDWSDDVLFSIGRMLAEAVCRSTDLFEMKPIVQGITDQERGERSPMNCITPTKECEKHRGDLNQRMEIMHPLVFPMLIKPKAWTNAHSGGLISEYQQIDACVIKYRYKESVTVAEEAGMGEMFKALNAIQDTPFKINKEIRDVVKVTRTNGAGKLPAPDKNEMLPIKPWDTEEQINEMKASNNPVWIAWKRETAKQYDKWHRENSKRTALINQLRLADDFGDYDQLYWIWTVDYRGRAYPEQDWVSPQGDDVGRALMLFAEGKALGEHGSDWLAIHGANCYGIDKVPFQDRINWVLENKNNILASADRPLDFKWWEEADKPYQFLAFCFEWAGFMDEGEAFVSYLPIQMDGTCSGLQHFSGLLKDQVGGDAVNLNPNDVPADVYAEVAIVTNKLLHQLKNGGEKDEPELAEMWLKCGVTRAETKHNVMTLPYGATLQGFTDQLKAYCLKKSILPVDVDMGKACRMLAKVNLEAIKQVLVKSVEAMKFLQDVAGFMGKNQLPLKWTTPIGFRCFQKVMKTKTTKVTTTFGGCRLEMTLQGDTKKFDSRGMRSKSAPNFIHSMDAGHLMLTVLGMVDEGITDFSLIHDSFGTHAANIPTMNRVLREKFVEIYSEDWIEKFIVDVRSQLTDDKMITKFDELVAEGRPSTGTLDINTVIDSPYFFN